MLNFSRLLMLACVATAASATQITFTAAPSGGVGFWTASVSDLLTQQKLLCDDDSHTTYVSGTAFEYDRSTEYSSSTPWASSRWKDAYPTDYVIRYRAAAIIMAEILGLYAPPLGTVPTVSDYQYAVWDLFDVDNSINLAWNSTAYKVKKGAMDKASADTVLSLDYLYSNLVVYTPNPGGRCSPQEFLAMNAVPEPSQFAGLFLALGAGWYVRRRRKA